jgi:hypothetical protein
MFSSSSMNTCVNISSSLSNAEIHRTPCGRDGRTIVAPLILMAASFWTYGVEDEHMGGDGGDGDPEGWEADGA